jgi:O-antigen/teichoic acid export membrane protein
MEEAVPQGLKPGLLEAGKYGAAKAATPRDEAAAGSAQGTKAATPRDASVAEGKTEEGRSKDRPLHTAEGAQRGKPAATGAQARVPALRGSLRERFVVGAFWSVAGAIIARGFLLGASVVCAWFLGKEGFGALGMIQSTTGMFGILAGLGLGLTATKYVSELRRLDPQRTGRILALSSAAAFVSGSVITIAVILLAPYLAQHVLAAPQLAGPLAIGAGLVFFGALNGAQTGALAGFEAFPTIARVNIYTGLASFPLIVLGVWRWGLPGAVWGSVAGLAINWALNRGALRKECAKAGVSYQFAHCSQELSILHRFSLPAFLGSIVVVSAIWVCNAMLARQPQGYAELGLYAAADKWRVLIVFVPTYVFAMVMPVLSNLHGEGDAAAFQKVFKANVQLNGSLVLVMSAAIAVFAGPLMRVYGNAFRGGRVVLLVLAFAAMAQVFNTMLGQPLVAAHKMWWRFGFDVLFVVLLVGLAWVLIPKRGAVGLAWAYGVGYATAGLGLFVFSFRKSFSC